MGLALWGVCAAECLFLPPGVSLVGLGERTALCFVRAGQAHLSVHGRRPDMGKASLCLGTFRGMYLCVG